MISSNESTKMLAADIIIFATPVWWGIQSSLIQRIIERLDELNDEQLEARTFARHEAYLARLLRENPFPEERDSK